MKLWQLISNIFIDSKKLIAWWWAATIIPCKYFVNNVAVSVCRELHGITMCLDCNAQGI